MAWAAWSSVKTKMMLGGAGASSARLMRVRPNRAVRRMRARVMAEGPRGGRTDAGMLRRGGAAVTRKGRVAERAFALCVPAGAYTEVRSLGREREGPHEDRRRESAPRLSSGDSREPRGRRDAPRLRRFPRRER